MSIVAQPRFYDSAATLTVRLIHGQVAYAIDWLSADARLAFDEMCLHVNRTTHDVLFYMASEVYGSDGEGMYEMSMEDLQGMAKGARA